MFSAKTLSEIVKLTPMVRFTNRTGLYQLRLTDSFKLCYNKREIS